MSGYAGGGGKATVESRQFIDVLELHRRGYLNRPQCFSISPSRDDRGTATLYVKAERELITLYFFNISHDEPSIFEQRIIIIWKPCRFGGERAWFVCSGDGSGVRCDRRAIKLYRAGRQFACRECCRLVYTSQRRSTHQRRLRKAQKIRMRFGGNPSMLNEFPEKPKGMHWRTYERWRRTLDAAEERSTIGLMNFVERLGRRISRRA